MTRLLLGCGVLATLAACAGGPSAPGTAATGTTGVGDDASLFRLVTLTEPFSQYTVLPLADEFASGRLNGSEAHAPIVRVLLNAKAAGVLQAGRFPTGGSFPDGAIVFKEVRATAGSAPNLYVVMLKDSTNGLAGNGWLWAEYTPSGSTVFPISRRGNGCISCHQRDAGPQHDLVRSFERQR